MFPTWMDRFRCSRGLMFFPDGNLLVATEHRVVEVDRSGSPVEEGIHFIVGDAVSDPEGVAYREGSDRVYVSAESDRAIFEFSRPGWLLNAIEMAPTRCLGVGWNEKTGTLLVVDDSADSLSEITPLGTSVAQIDLQTLAGLDDPEGISVDSEGGLVYVGSRNTVAVFRMVPRVSVTSEIVHRFLPFSFNVGVGFSVAGRGYQRGWGSRSSGLRC